MAGLLGVIGAATATADAHIRLSKPAPRSQADALKAPDFPAPCGKVPRGTTPTAVYKPGDTVAVSWVETIGHEGCFQIGFSTDDATFTVLKQIPDVAGGGGMVYNDTVTLPVGVTCKNCTLQLRQIMLDGLAVKTCATNAVPPNGVGGNGNTYYSCADICVGVDCPEAGAPTPPDSGTDPGLDSGVTTVPTDGGGKLVDAGGDGPAATAPRDLHSGDGGGCSVALGATSGVSFAVTAGLLALALVRRRRRA